MNGVHDMGGMHGFGPIITEANEPVFHHDWEGHAIACVLAMGAWGKWNLDRSRFFRESIPGPRYLNSSYYEIWLNGLIAMAADAGFLSFEELASGHAEPGKEKRTPGFTADKVIAAMRRGGSARRADANFTARFAPGDKVCARNMNPRGHTRLPRYVRGRCGVVDRVHGDFVFPDSNAHFKGETPQTVYSVRFTAAELWGADAAHPDDKVYVDMWDSYLEQT